MKFAPQCMALAVLTMMFAACGLPGMNSNAAPLPEIKYHYTFAMRTYECDMVISDQGEVQVAQSTTTDQSKAQRAEGRLTPEQRAQLAEVFHDWKTLKHGYSDVDMTAPAITISYDDYEVTAGGGRLTPSKFTKAQGLLQNIAMSVLNPPEPTTTKP